MVKCIGFGPREYHCTEDAIARDRLWCHECEQLRQAHIKQQFDKVIREMEERKHAPRATDA